MFVEGVVVVVVVVEVVEVVVWREMLGREEQTEQRTEDSQSLLQPVAGEGKLSGVTQLPVTRATAAPITQPVTRPDHSACTVAEVAPQGLGLWLWRNTLRSCRELN